jgi:hypothetical protein
LICFGVSGTFLTVTLAGQSRLDAFLLSRLQVEGVTLDVLDDLFLQDLALKALERALQTLAFVNVNFSQRELTSASNADLNPSVPVFLDQRVRATGVHKHLDLA